MRAWRTEKSSRSWRWPKRLASRSWPSGSGKRRSDTGDFFGQQTAIWPRSGSECVFGDFHRRGVFGGDQASTVLHARKNVASKPERGPTLPLIELAIGVRGRQGLQRLLGDQRGIEQQPADRKLGHQRQEAARVERDQLQLVRLRPGEKHQ